MDLDPTVILIAGMSILEVPIIPDTELFLLASDGSVSLVVGAAAPSGKWYPPAPSCCSCDTRLLLLLRRRHPDGWAYMPPGCTTAGAATVNTPAPGLGCCGTSDGWLRRKHCS
jgi:hypothetical protein